MYKLPLLESKIILPILGNNIAHEIVPSQILKILFGMSSIGIFLFSESFEIAAITSLSI